MSSMHEPTPEFERYLEWQVTTAFRRQDRFTRPSPPRVWLRTAPAMALSVLLGAGVVMASGRIQESQQKQVLTVQQEGELQLAQMQVGLAQTALELAQKRVEIGTAPRSEAMTADRDLQVAMLRLQRVRLNIEEVQQSGRPAQDDVTAPLVQGHDFVTERLALDKQIAGAMAADAEGRVQTMLSRFDVGLATEVEVSQAKLERARAMSVLSSIDEKMALRKRFVGGGLSAEDATRQRLLLAARSELRTSMAALELAMSRDEQLANRSQAGTADEADALKARLEVLSLQQDVRRLRDRIATLEKGGALPDGRER